MKVQYIQKQIQNLQKKAKEIENKNRLFAKMSPAQRRVAIAEDVLAQIKARKYTIEQGTYVELKDSFRIDDANVEIADVVKTTGCNVCARGAAFVSACNVFNNCSIADLKEGKVGQSIENISGFEKYEKKFWTQRQLGILETFFESINNGQNIYGYASEKDTVAAAFWAATFDSPEKGLIAIMKNIITNKGDIKIPKEFFE